MKKSIFLVLFIILTSSTIFFGQQLNLNAESGNISIEQGNCWGFSGVQYYSGPSKIAGSYSIISTNKINSLDETLVWIKSPWMTVGSGNITFQAKLDATAGIKSRSIVISYIPYDPSSVLPSKEGTRVKFFTYNFPKPFKTTIYSISAPIPPAIANSTDVYKIMISFIGIGGNPKIISDNYIFPGTYNSNPANSCLPSSAYLDTDSDGVPDSEDDYPTDLHRAYNSYYPSEAEYGTLAFEDNWPSKGDYDFNDVVVDYRMNTVTNASNNVVEVIGEFVLRASGANFHNGFGFQLDEIIPNKISGVSGSSINPSSSIFSIASNGVESGQAYATCIVFEDFFIMMPPGPGPGVNTVLTAPHIPPVNMTIVVTFINNGVVPSGGTVARTDFSEDAFNFFIVVDGNRGTEIHLPDRIPTSLVNISLLGTNDDTSNPGANRYYKTTNNLPWGLNIIEGYDYTIERAAINEGYLYFIEWAESNGTAKTDWFSNLSAGYRNSFKIY